MRDLRGIVPDNVHESLCEYTNIEGIPLPISHERDMGILFTDIKSFTRLTEQVSGAGHYGVETITGILKRYFEAMESCIRDHGGYLVKYGGDSLLSVFPGDQAHSVGRILGCRVAMFDQLTDLNHFYQQQYGIQIQIHGGISWGRTELRIVGNPKYHLDYYFVGDALQEAYEVGETAQAGEIRLHNSFNELPLLSPEKKTREIVDSGFASGFVSSAVKDKISGMEFSAELRNTAVVFIGISPSEGQSHISCEDYHPFYTAVQQKVYAMGGNINKIDYTDKGYTLIITFGVPGVHFDDTERAFICTWKLLQIPVKNIRIRIGITYSNIYAGILGTENRWEYGIIGNAVNISARLMSEAGYGEIAFSAVILPKIQSHFESRFVKRVHVKGIKEEIDIYSPVRELPENWTAFRKQYKEQELIGCEAEICGITKTDSNFIVVSGESGVGKSFLTYRILKERIERGQSIELYVMDEYSRNSPFEFIRKVLGRKLDAGNFPDDLDKLLAWCDKVNLAIDESLIRGFFRHNVESSRNALPIEAVEIVEQVFSDILRKLWKDVRLIALDNMQWMDAKSRKVFDRALPGLLYEGVGIMITTRDSTLLDIPESLNPTVISLGNLDRENAATLIRSGIQNIAGDAVENLITITEGNPMFINEMCRLIRENFDCQQNILTEAHIGIMLRQGIIPQTLENLFIRQYEHLDESSRQLLKVASIVGRAFSVDALAVIGKAEFSRRVVEILHMLNVIAIIDEKNINPEIEYIFSNNLMREAIYRTILKSEKRDLHNRIAGYYEHKHKNDLYPWLELIANHYILSENHEKTCRFSLDAAHKNFSLYSLTESAYFFRIAHEHCQDETLRIEIELHIIDILLLQGDTSDAETRLHAIDESYLDEKNRDYHRYLTARLNDKTSRFSEQVSFAESVMEHFHDLERYHQVKILYLNALRETGMDFEEKALEYLDEVRKLGDERIVGQMCAILGQYYLDQARYGNAESFMTERYRIVKKLKDQVHVRLALSGLGALALRRGDIPSAEKYYRQALEVAEKLGDKDGYGTVQMDLATLLRYNGENQKAIDVYRNSLKLARISGNRKQETTVLYNIGEALYYLEKLDEALDYFRQSLEIAKKIGDLVSISYCYDAIGDATFSQGDIENARQTYLDNLSLQEKLNDLEGVAHTYGNLGNIAKAEKNYPLAIEYYRKQQSMLEEIGDKDGEGRAWFNWAMVHMEREEVPEAIEKLRKAIDLFTEIGAKQFIEIAEGQMRQLEDMIPHEPQ